MKGKFKFGKWVADEPERRVESMAVGKIKQQKKSEPKGKVKKGQK